MNTGSEGVLGKSDQSKPSAHDILSAMAISRAARFRLLGFVPLTFFLLQALHYWRFGGLGHLAWMCNIGNLLLALGLFLNHTELMRAAAIWTLPGLPIWFWFVWLKGETSVSSTLAHVGGIAVGVFVLSRVRMDKTAWVYAFVWYLFMQIVSRVLTSPELNVNVAHRIQPGWEGAFGSFWKFWIVMAALTGTALWLLGIILWVIWPAPRIDPSAATDPVDVSV